MAFTIYYKRSITTALVLAGLSMPGCDLFNNKPDPVIPELTTKTVTGISPTGAASGGNILADGGAAITDKGIVWSTSQSPTVSSGTKVASGSGSDAFTSQITGLTANTVYYVRAYAKNMVGIGYGNEVSFTTTGSLPTVTTSSVSQIKSTSATGGGNVVSDGGVSVTSRGIVWDTNPGPTVSLSTKTTGSGTGSFASDINNLDAETKYYVRAYATNSLGTAYGDEINFTTTSYAVGDPALGGIIAYILQSGDPGYMSGEKRLLIIEASDQSTNAPWGCYGTGIVGARNTAIGKGLLNTAAIVAECVESGTAAKISMDLSSNGYDDWWLPGKDELYKVYLNKSAISAGAIAIGGEELSNTTYISSSELDGGSGFGLDFSTGMFNNGNAKPTANKFRAMRANFETKLEVGDYYQGGIVGYILQSGDPGYSSANTKGFIVAPHDQSTGAAYGCTGSFFNITDTQLHKGDENTQAIVNLCADSGTAAKICNDLDLNGYTDWWLPSLDELQAMYDNRTLINNAALQLANISGAAFNSSSYRSSSEFNASYAYTLSFLSGFTNNANSKSTLYRVRAIRYF